MESQINTKSEQQQTTPHGYYVHSIGREGFILYLSNRERDQAEHHRDKSRWYHNVGGWMCRGWRATRRWRRATVVIMFATVVNVGVVYYQWREMRTNSADTKTIAKAAKQSAEVAEKTLVLSQRPWVPAYLALDGPFEFSDDGRASLSTKYTLANVGHSVADEVEIFIEMVTYPFSQESFYEPLERQKELCEKIKKTRSNLPHKLGHAIFPGETSNGTRTVPMEKEEIASSAARMDPRLPKTHISPILIGCVLYKFTFAPEYHSTGFIYSIFRSHPDRPNEDFSIEINKMVPLDSLKLKPFAFGGRYAD